VTRAEEPVLAETDFAVITGASTGIGLELAKIFAQLNYRLLIAADDDALDTARTVLAENGNPVEAVRADLSGEEGNRRLLQAIGGRRVDVLILNAGIGNHGRFIDIPWPDEQRLIGLNIASPVLLAKELLPQMVQNKAGRVLLTSSVAARMPGPYYATYAASKSFLLSLAEALRYEVKDNGVTISVLMPGPTDTEFFDRADMDAPVSHADKDDPARVARDGFDALMAGRDHIVGGSWLNKLQMAGSHLIPEPVKAALHARMTKPD
jgi:short-subunit dehydrogenase